ncbi:MAG: rane protein, partial [Nocardioidaceae bacterium]|nr:rane protein [Nocardioidaceae bacterium]
MADAARPDSTTDESDETRPVRAAEPVTSGPTATDDSNRTAADYNDVAERPAADHPGKVEKPSDLKKPSVLLAVRRSVREFLDDDCTDLAASLTYYSVLALFPAMIALMSLLGVVGQGTSSLHAVEDVLRPLVSRDAYDTLVK